MLVRKYIDLLYYDENTFCLECFPQLILFPTTYVYHNLPKRRARETFGRAAVDCHFTFSVGNERIEPMSA